MPFENWIAYVIAYAVISVIPGPSVFMVVGQTLSRGARAAIACIAGDLAGGVIVMSASYLGLGLVLASSSLAFMVLKWAGVAYMAYLGMAQISAARKLTVVEVQASDARRGSFGAGFLTGVLNPKAIMFYMAFLAQFVEPTAPQLPQFLILMASSTVVVATVLGAYALLAVKISARVQSPRARRRMGYAAGSCLLGGSVVMAATR
ncbi:LysE family translocator [Paracoccus sp. M683]|uniref:LysE family translocator n=1 Tax=Paracoccus sp. M683 TaxID=2594268 RepID=UPI00117F15E8|nr:LysE family translocator [Paracoccus sp. M683]TRW95716.1 LysE family translocator [Paracoccus sp. M683]